MNRNQRPNDDQRPASGPPVDGEADFIDRLERKLARGNLRRWQRLMAWAGLLDAAGWCVALADSDGTCWLGDRARRDLQRRECVPATWPELAPMLEGLPASRVAVDAEAVRVWSGGEPRVETEPAVAGPLTKRETEVWHWIRCGKTGPEIAVILGCSPRTVETHVANLYKKIGVRHRGAAILGTSFTTE